MKTAIRQGLIAMTIATAGMPSAQANIGADSPDVLHNLPWAEGEMPDPLALYGGPLKFDVLRDGKKVGAHETVFERDEAGQLIVRSNMALSISILGFTVYSFDWKANEVWADGRLAQLDVDLKDGGDKSTFTIDAASFADAVISSNHWNPVVLGKPAVLNSLTGELNQVEITPAGMDQVKLASGVVSARRYAYDGDLTDVSVWYDEDGRWVKLQFLGKDGSTIEYRCTACGHSPSGSDVAG